MDEGVASFEQTDDAAQTIAVQESTPGVASEPHQADLSPSSPAAAPCTVEPAMRSDPGQDGIAAKPEARTRSRRRLEEEANKEKTGTRPETAKRQKSLFDF